MFTSSSGRDLLRQLKQRWRGFTGPPYPHLLSIHIPKTAGRTFREILRSQYGVNGVLSLDHHYLANRKERLEDYPTHRYPVIHGHLPYQQISKAGLPTSRYITWLRHPVDRVISNYYFYCSSEYPALKRRDPTKELIPFERFIRRSTRRNIICKYLEGMPLNDFFFVGFQDQFDTDIRKLGQKLGWQLNAEHLALRINDNTKARQSAPSLSEELILKIRAYNEKDLALYEKAKQLSEQGLWS